MKTSGHAEVLDTREHPELVARITLPELAKITERVVLIRILSYDWNCPKYITPCFTADEVNELVAPLKARIAKLESKIVPPS